MTTLLIYLKVKVYVGVVLMVNRKRQWEKSHKLICLDTNLYHEITSKKKKGQTYNQFIKNLLGDGA